MNTEALVKSKTNLQSHLLPGNVVTVYSIDYSKFERWIKDVFGKEFEIAPTEECSNDTTLSFDGVGEHPEWHSEESLKSVEEFLVGNGSMPQYHTRKLLEWLCRNGFIPVANYSIRVSW